MDKIKFIILVLSISTISCNAQCCKGRDGKDGRDGRDGRDGKDGESCSVSEIQQFAEKNWKECAWNRIEDGRDFGLIKSCAFNKKSNSSYLKVAVSGDMRLHNCNNCCKRWFVTFDDKECSPIPIDGIIYLQVGQGTQNTHRPRVIRGHCMIPKQGAVNVAINVGNCPSTGPGDAYTGTQSSFRIFIEEVNAPQP